MNLKRQLNLTIRSLLVALCVTLSGCQGLLCCWPLPWRGVGHNASEYVYQGPVTVPVAIDTRFANVVRTRIAFLASGQSQGFYEPSRRLIQELRVQFQEQDLQEVVVPENDAVGLHFDQIVQGKVNELEIVRVSQAYNADTIGLVRVNSFETLPAMRMSAAVAFIDCNETVVFCSVDETWDLSDPETRSQWDQFLSRRRLGDSLEPTVQNQSPQLMFQFAAEQVVTSLRAAGY